MSQEIEFKKKIDLVLKDAPENRHSYFQLKHFVLGKEPTRQAQMWQCLRELQSRKDSMDRLELDIEETIDRVELLDIERRKKALKLIRLKDKKVASVMEKEVASLMEEEWKVRLRQYKRQKANLFQTIETLKKNLDFVKQEARFFLQAYEALAATTVLKDYDDLDSQKEYWNEKITQAINLKMMLGQALDIELVQTALSLNDDAPIKQQMHNTLKHIERQMNGLKLQYIQKLNSREENGAQAIES